MGSIHIKDFKYGMDRRRLRMAGTPGTLWTGKNVHINRGGDIERPKKFSRVYGLPTSLTQGLAAIRDQLYVFGQAAAPTMPAGVQYQRTQHPGGAVLITRILDAKPVDGKLYTIVQFADGNIYHYFDGSRVGAWDAISDANATAATTAAYMAELINADSDVIATPSAATITMTAKVPGTAFVLAATAVNGGAVNDQTIDIDVVQANVAAVAEVRATGSVTVSGGSLGTPNKVTSVTVNAVEMLAAPVSWVSSHAATASAVATAINNGAHGYTATAALGVVTITAPVGQGAAANGLAVVATATGNVVVNATNLIGGVTAVAAVAQVSRASFGGTFEPLDFFTITVNGHAYVVRGRASATGVSVFVHKKRVWTVANSLWYYSKINTPTDWTNADASAGAGFINVSSDSEGTERLVGAEAYGSQVAVFSRHNIWIYNIGTDALEFALDTPIRFSGTPAARAILGYGNSDVFFIDDSGVRSLRAKQYSTQAEATDVGAPIDPFIHEYLATITDGQLQKACSTIEPRDRRFWLAIGTRIFVLSSFPTSNISAWTYYDPGFQIDNFARAYNRVYVRSGDFIYAYGGVSGSEYPADGEMEGLVELPYAAVSPPQMFELKGFDMSGSGSWDVRLLMDPNNESASQHVGTVIGCTHTQGDIAIPGRTTHVGAQLTCAKGGQASICNLTIWHDGKEPAV